MATLKITKTPGPVSFSRNPIVFRFFASPYGANETESNSRFIVSVEAETAQYAFDFREIKQFELYPDERGVGEVDISSLLDAQLKYFVPDTQSPGLTRASSQAARFRIKVKFLNDYELIGSLQSNTFHVIKGGLAKEDAFVDHFFDQMFIKKQALQYKKDWELIDREAPRWMMFLGHPEYGPEGLFKIKYRLHYSDGTFSEYEVDGETAIIRPYMLMCLPVGYVNGLISFNQLQKMLVKYEVSVFIHNEWGVLTERVKVHYELDYRHYYAPRVLHFHSSVGSFETQLIRGTVEAAPDYEKQAVSRVNIAMFASKNVITADDGFYNSREREKLTGDTGFISYEQVNRLRDLLNSNLAYENIGGKRLKPVIIDAKNAKLYSSQDQLFSLAVTWRDAYADTNFTPDQWVEEPEACPNVELLSMVQLRGNQITVIWQLPDGYFSAELRYGTTNNVNALTNTTAFLNGNAGQINLNMTSFIPQAGQMPSATVYFWARVICRSYAPVSYGAWLANGGVVVYRDASPYMPNMYAVTYKGVGMRRLYYPNGSDNILSLMTNPNTGTWQVQCYIAPNTATTGTGSGGGNFQFIVSNSASNTKVNYSPVNNDFEGTEWISIRAVASEIGGNWGISPSGIAKLFVTVQGVANTGTPNLGSVYIRMTLGTNVELTTEPGAFGGTRIFFKKNITVSFFSDPLGITPVDLTGQQINFSITKTLISGGSSAPFTQSFTAAGTGMNLGLFLVEQHEPSWFSNGNWFGGQIYIWAYALDPSSQYYVL